MLQCCFCLLICVEWKICSHDVYLSKHMFLQERYMMLKNDLNKVELLESFGLFLKDGIAHIIASGGEGKAHPGDKNSVFLPADTVEKMKDIQYEVEKLAKLLTTGMRDSTDTYSSSVEDYVDQP